MKKYKKTLAPCDWERFIESFKKLDKKNMKKKKKKPSDEGEIDKQVQKATLILDRSKTCQWKYWKTSTNFYSQEISKLQKNK